MVALFVICLLVSLFLSLLVVARARGHARAYAQEKPQRFHKGNIPR